MQGVERDDSVAQTCRGQLRSPAGIDSAGVGFHPQIVHAQAAGECEQFRQIRFKGRLGPRENQLPRTGCDCLANRSSGALGPQRDGQAVLGNRATEGTSAVAVARQVNVGHREGYRPAGTALAAAHSESSGAPACVKIVRLPANPGNCV